MLLLKRLLTAFALFVCLFLIMFFGSLVVGGAVAGSQAGGRTNPTNFQEGYAIGQQAGAEFAAKWAIPICEVAGGVALVGAVSLSFSGVFPWCRRAPVPPPLPVGGP